MYDEINARRLLAVMPASTSDIGDMTVEVDDADTDILQ